MKMKLLPFLLLIIGCQTDNKSSCNYITDYYQTIYKADYEFQKESYEKAFELYQEAFNSCEAINTLSYNEIDRFAETSAILNKYSITYEYVKKQIQIGKELNSFQNNPHLEKFLSSKYGIKLLSEYENLRKMFLDNADFELRDELVKMRIADQMYRGGSGEANWTKQDSIDKLHELRLIEIFESIGYPTEKMVGQRTMDYPVDVGLLLLHTKDSIRMNYFVPKVNEFIINGTAPPRVLGTMIDQYHLYNDKPQIYGTYSAQGGGYAIWYTDFLKDSTNYFKKEFLNKESGIKAIYNLKFISELDTLTMSIYPSESKNKIVMAFLDPYDSSEPLKFRRYNRFYVNDRIVDSIESILK